MKTTAIGVYTTHDKAVEAAKILKTHGFSDKQVSILWHKKEIDEEYHQQEKKITTTEAAEIGTTISIGGVLGVLTGIGVFAIPGLGFLYGAGALIGAVAGADFGIVAGGIIGALSISGVKRHHEEKYDADLRAGKYLVLVQGGKEEVQQAKSLLDAHGEHAGFEVHS
ncbi:MAG: hypothetical protein R2794_12140 [Chitinophagales bacterium]